MTRLFTARAVAVLALTVGVHRLGAQRTSSPVLSPADLPSQLSVATRQTIARLGDSLRMAHLPDAPLYAKAAEGVLKGAEEMRIVTAVRTLARELGEARAALGTSVGDDDLVAAASALHVGATAAMLTQLRDTQRSAGGASTSLATPLVALADLLSRRVPAAAAASAIDALVSRRAPSEDFAALRAGVERDIVAGRAPEAAVAQRTQVLIRNIEAKKP
jgi:hypothetical protein